MNWENLRTCCCKALKHNQTECPVCGRKLIPEQTVQPTSTGLKVTLLIPFIALSLNSCNESNYYEKGIVKDKIENKVYLTPLDDTTNVYRILDCDTTIKAHRRTVKNIYMNMNKGDTIYFYNAGNKIEVTVAYRTRTGGIIGGGYHSVYNVKDINGVKVLDLPNLVRKQELEQKAKQAQLQYEKAKRSR